MQIIIGQLIGLGIGILLVILYYAVMNWCDQRAHEKRMKAFRVYAAAQLDMLEARHKRMWELIEQGRTDEL